MQQWRARPVTLQLHREACVADDCLQLWGHDQLHAEIAVKDQASPLAGCNPVQQTDNDSRYGV